MSRPKKIDVTTAELDAQIAKLQRQRNECQTLEDQRRGQLVRECLEGPQGETVKRVFEPLVSAKDRALFGLSK